MVAHVLPFSPRPPQQSEALSPCDRVLRSHKIVETAANLLDTGAPGSGVKSVVFAAATHLALTIGPEEAGAFFNMIAGVAREVRPLGPESAA